MSSFTQMHNDYLDPDRHLWPDEDYGYNEVLAELKKLSSNRWQWEKIDCCWTGKDADLEACGQQGLHLDYVDEEHAHATVHAGSTQAGIDVCLNFPDTATEEENDKARDAYIDQMTEVVCGCGYPGEWSGDDWYLTTEHQIKVPVVFNEDDTVNAEATAEALITEGEKSLKAWDEEMSYVDLAGCQLAGWKDAKGRRMKEGRVPKCAAWKS